MRTSLFALFFSLAALPHAIAQTGSFTGKVSDPNGAAVSQAIVRAVKRDGGIQRTAVSDDQGKFRIDEAVPGTYLIQAETRDLESTSAIEVTLPPGGTADASLTVALRSVAERITVTAENSPVSFDQVAKALTIIDARELTNRQTIAVSDALKTVPGLRVQQLGGPGSFVRVLTRGLRASDTSVLIDGFRFRDVASTQGDATGFLSDLLVIDSSRIEILRGSGSSLYGTNAIGGVVQLVTDQGGGPFHGEIQADGGGLGMARGVAKFSGSSGRNEQFRYSGGLTHLNVTRGVDGNDPVHNTSGQFWGQYLFRPGTTLSGRYFGNDLMLGLNNNPTAGANLPSGPNPIPAIAGQTFFPAQDDPDHRRASNFNSALVLFNQQLGNWANLRAGYQALLSNRDDINGPAGPGFQSPFRNVSSFNGRIDTAQTRIDITKWRTHLISAGYEYEREAFQGPSYDENPDPAFRVNANAMGSQQSNAVFVQDQFRLFGERLLISLSGRYQNFNLARPTFIGGTSIYQNALITTPPDALTGDAAIAYFFRSTGTKIRAHVGNSYRVPSLYERFGTFFFGGVFSGLGDPRLSPERAIGVDGGIDQYFASNRLRVSASYFYTRLQSVIAYGNLVNDPFERFGGYVNAGGGLARGVEFSVEAKPWRGMTITPSYTYTNALERQSILANGSIRPIRYFPHMFQLVAMQQFGSRINVTFDLLAASDYVSGIFGSGATQAFLFPGPRQANLAGSYSLPISDRATLQFYTRISNVFNQTYYEDGYKTPKAWAVGGIKLLF